jgi:hypothetical protein
MKNAFSGFSGLCKSIIVIKEFYKISTSYIIKKNFPKRKGAKKVAFPLVLIQKLWTGNYVTC